MDPTNTKTPLQSRTLWLLGLALALVLGPVVWTKYNGPLPDLAREIVTYALTMVLGAAGLTRVGAKKQIRVGGGGGGAGDDDPTLLPKDWEPNTDDDWTRRNKVQHGGTGRGQWLSLPSAAPGLYAGQGRPLPQPWPLLGWVGGLALVAVACGGCVSRAEYLNAIVTLDRGTHSMRAEHKQWVTTGRFPTLTPSDTALRLRWYDEYDATKSELIAK